jgi:NitT/TauT family transport system substrate-binding protein
MAIKRWVSVAAIVLGIAVVSACGDDDDSSSSGTTSSEGNKQVTLLFPSPDTTFYYPFDVAEAKGYFEDEGIDVTFEPVDGSAKVVQQIVGGNADAGVAGPASVLVGISEGFDARVIYTYIYGNTFDIAAPSDSDVKSMPDLRGKALGISEFAGGEVPLVRGLLKQFDLEDEVDLVPVGSGVQAIQALQSDRVAAYASGLLDFQLMKNAGYEFTSINTPEGKQFPANVLLVSGEAFDADPELWAGVSRAVAKATHYALTHQDEALEIMRDRLPAEYEDLEQGKAYIEAMFGFTTPPGGVEGEYGIHQHEGWEAYQKFLLQGNKGDEGDVLSGEVDLENVLDDEIPEQANDFPRASGG